MVNNFVFKIFGFEAHFCFKVLITPGQLLQSAYTGHLPQTQLHPATQSRLDDAKSKNLLTVYW